ncbi:MAG: acyl-ACP--UDP-N-acetylglucosamine O-acyltransferase [Candidatus Cloacimonetes bacterium]|nr:acyl-ACP--UDP-N-acetylglucosamine O-acyltransferase [Candidatus Cloacimonadota bacterium]
MSNIHSTAIVHPEAQLAPNVTVGPYAIIGQYVSIDSGTEVMTHAIVEGRTTIGKNNKIYPSASVGLPCQDLKYNGEPTKLIIGANNHIRELSTIHLSATLDEDTVVGNNNLIMAYAHIAHNCQIGSNVILANAVNLAGHVHIADFVTIGGMTAVSQFVEIGKHAFIGGCSAIKKDIPPFTRGQGNPYSMAGINTVGLSRRGFSDAEIEGIVQIFKIFYLKKYNVAQAIEHAENIKNLTDGQKTFIEFCKSSKRGIVK